MIPTERETNVDLRK